MYNVALLHIYIICVYIDMCIEREREREKERERERDYVPGAARPGPAGHGMACYTTL